MQLNLIALALYIQSDGSLTTKLISHKMSPSNFTRLGKSWSFVGKRRCFGSYPPPQGGLSYLSVPGRKGLSPWTVGRLLDASVERFGDSQGVVFCAPQKIRKSFGELRGDVDKLAGGLLALGFQKGDRLGIWGPNSYPWYIAHKAGMKAGLVVVNINPAYQVNEIHYCLNKVGVKGLLIAEPFKSSDYYEMMVKTIPEIMGSDPGKIKGPAVPSLTTLISMGEEALKGTFSLEEVLAKGSSPQGEQLLRKAEPLVQFDDVCNIQFTSGTTGNPKGVMLSHHNIVNNGLIIADRFSFEERDKICLPVPLFHCFGSVVGTLAALAAGSTAVYPSPGFSPPDILKALGEEKCTVVYGTPTMHIDILHSPQFGDNDLSSLRLAVTAGSICPEQLIRQMKERYTVDNVASCYGMTETSPVSFQSLPDDSDSLRAETVGYPTENVEIKLTDKQGRIVPLGQEGELCVRGYCNMLGYWEDGPKTAETIDAARWLRTGDLSIMLPSGHARIVGRLKDQIIRGGENIYPRELEDFLHSHPAIQEVQVVGVPDPRMGEEVATWILLKEGHSLDEQQVKDFCKGKIAHYKIPRYIVFTKSFPKTTSGKVQKFKIREDIIKRFQIQDITHQKYVEPES